MAEKKINGREFKTEPLLATQAIVLQARLMRMAGPGLAQIGDIFAGMAKDAPTAEKEKSAAAALRAFAAVFAASTPEDMAKVISDVVGYARIKRPSGSYDACDLDGDFVGAQKKDIIPLVVFVLREQLGDFFDGLPVSGFLEKMKKD